MHFFPPFPNISFSERKIVNKERRRKKRKGYTEEYEAAPLLLL